jgi:hypothetical protein
MVLSTPPSRRRIVPFRSCSLVHPLLTWIFPVAFLRSRAIHRTVPLHHPYDYISRTSPHRLLRRRRHNPFPDPPVALAYHQAGQRYGSRRISMKFVAFPLPSPLRKGVTEIRQPNGLSSRVGPLATHRTGHISRCVGVRGGASLRRLVESFCPINELACGTRS